MNQELAAIIPADLLLDERLRAVADDAPFAVFAKRADGRYVFANRWLARLLGVAPEELVGRTVADVLPGDVAVRTRERELRGAVSHLWTEDAIPTPSGERTLLTARFPIALAGEMGICGIAFDVTDRDRTQQELRDTEERFRSVLDQAGAMAHLGAWWIDVTNPEDLDSSPLRWSDEVYRIFGYEPGEVAVSNELFFRHVHPDDRRRVADAVSAALSERRRYAIEHRIVRRDGVERVVLEHGEAQHDGAGRLFRIVGAVHDVTDRKRAEEALREADRRKDEFLGMLSHELRNPLAPIRNSIYVLRHTEPGSEQGNRAQEVIERQTEHLTRLVDDLLDVTRIARGKIELRRTRVDLRDLVWRAADDFRHLMRDRSVELRVVADDEKVWADADPTRISQVVGNLLHNASKFTRGGDEVTVSLRAEGGAAEIRVRDTGAGIEPSLLPHVFDPFVQGERTLARTEGGLGLGLALVKGITELHGGTVRVESAGKGRGAEFVVRLPLATPAGTRDATSPVARSSGGLRVLVVDDNADAADSLAEIARMLGHDAEVAYDGPSALAKARALPPDVVLCDIGLPGMSGYEVARALRAGGASGMQLFAVSGYAQPEDVRRAIEAGFDGHVAKPADPALVERLLAR
ncbi:PAS domain-containing hybrid sensor histidine kinase/response regulator [Anaeromyxobacter oryzae]|uniref:histidine kinase n=1 Tax=Anaeromyxobacter oryzae TaxID=2918170 RepID=A0ABM7WR38_9BACT|nr:PAS domain S-box protein [Anaeromyxobacter oryzae]BDG01927.1 hypothetical protein AMOR_09230 [Anaeromyxobacter oryzae]